jgi:hypothetical protein
MGLYFRTSLIFWEVSMFDSLDEQMKKDDDRISTSKGRMIKYALYALAAAVVFGGLYLGVRMV